MRPTSITYAQNREDIILNEFLKDVSEGFYIDIGANHPVNDSVTKKFYNLGWRGINVEPNAYLHRLLLMDRPKDINLQVGVSDIKGELEFREYENHGLSTFSNSMKDEYNKKPNIRTDIFTDYKVPVVTLNEIFESVPNNKEVNFLKIDIEGYEYQALLGNDWEKNRPWIICIEADHVTNDWRPLLKAARYMKAFHDGLNEYYVSKEHQELIDAFSYNNAILLGAEPLAWSIQKRMLKCEAYSRVERQRAIQEKVSPQPQSPSLRRQFRSLSDSLTEYMYRRYAYIIFTEKDLETTATTKDIKVQLSEKYKSKNKKAYQKIVLISYNLLLKLTKAILKFKNSPRSAT